MLCAALLVVPLITLHGSSEASATADPASGARPGAPHPRPPRTVVTATATGTSGSSRAGGPTGPVVIADAPVLDVTATTVAPTTTTTTSAPPVTTTTTTTTAPPAVLGSSVATTGIVTYYDHPAGRCASPWLPFGTVVRVTNPANGASITCTVDDREADTERSIDLATATFAELAPLSQGVIDAHLSW